MKYLEKILDKNQKPFYRKDLEILLEKLEVKPGDIIMLHTSLKSFGYIVGGGRNYYSNNIRKNWFGRDISNAITISRHY